MADTTATTAEDVPGAPDARRPEPAPTPATPATPAAEPAQRDSDRIVGADGVRALAALAVIFSHLYQRLAAPAQPRWYQDLHAVLLHGAFGVSVFFVLSGMLLGYPFWKAYLTGTERPSLRHYARRRAARIVPAYWASLLVSFAVTSALFPTAEHTVRRLVAGLTFTSGFHYVTFFPTATNGPLWSISFEVTSYVLLPLALAGLFGWRRHRARARAAEAGDATGPAFRPGNAWLALGYWLLVIAAVLGLNGVLQHVVVLSDERKGWDFGDIGGAKYWMPGYNPLGFFAHFAIGVLAAWAIAAWRLRRGAADDPRGGRRWWWDLVALAAVAGILTLLWRGRWPAEPTHLENLQHQPFAFPGFALLVAALLVGLAHSRWLGRAFDNRFFRYTATVSFGLYVWHYLVLHWFSFITDKKFEYGKVTDWAQHLWLSAAVLVVSYAVATLSWRFLERPVLRSRWATRR